MIFQETELPGVFVVDTERKEDERGFFARTWCTEEFAAHGLNPRLVQCSMSFNHKRGTVRGMHWQAAPHGEAKLVRCTQGAIYDVVLDVRPGSSSFCRWIGVELSAQNRRALYIPEGCAHGFQTLTDDTEVFYSITEFFHPASSRGARWDDPAWSIHWPQEVTVISERDRTYPDFTPDRNAE